MSCFGIESLMKHIIKLLIYLIISSYSVSISALESEVKPKFSHYKVIAKKDFNNKVKLNTKLKKTKQFRTVLSGYLSGEPNFAGNYVIATWGCGSSCQGHAIINKVTGDVFWPNEIESTVNLFSCDKDALEFMTNSNLLVVNKPSFEGKVIQSFYEWKNNTFVRINKIEIKESQFCEVR